MILAGRTYTVSINVSESLGGVASGSSRTPMVGR